MSQKNLEKKLMTFELKIADENECFEGIGELSEYLSDILDCVGYGKNIVNLRRAFWREMDDKRREKCERDTRITTGSKGEGLSAPYESDTDRLYIYNYAVCRLPDDTEHDTKLLSEFIMEHSCHSGYFKLKLKTLSTEATPLHRIVSALVDIDGAKFISNKRYTEGLISDEKSILSGPAATEGDEYLSWDYVNAFRCTSQQKILSDWTQRDRPHGWPPESLIREISDQEAQLVPVGYIASGKEREFEWRVCFVQGEQKLTSSWHEFQYKVYILLKHIKTYILKPVCNEMSSFVMKNVTFWYVEQNASDIFTKQNLLTNVIQCLGRLKEAIIQKQLPYYFIKERNLLQHRIKESEQHQLTEILDAVMKNPKQIFECPKLQSALTVSRKELAEKGRWRDNLEELFVKSENIWRIDIPFEKEKQATRDLMQNIRLHSVNDEIRDLVWPTWREYDGEDTYEKLAQLVRNELS